MKKTMWSGNLSFGLVNVPVQLYTAVQDQKIRFNRFDPKSNSRIKYRPVSANNGEEVIPSETVKGYQVAPDQFVMLQPEDIEALKPKDNRSIIVTDFVLLSAIDPIYFDRPYYLMPDKGGEKGYQLLVTVMGESGKAAIAKFVMRGKEYLAAIRAVKGYLWLETMRFADEVVPPEEIGKPPAEKMNPKEVAMAHQLIEVLSTEFEPSRYKDEHRDRMMAMIQGKAKGHTIATGTDGGGYEAPIYNLMERLQQSIKSTKKGSLEIKSTHHTHRRRRSA